MLATDVLKALAKVLWGGNVEFVPEIDRLRPANKQPPKPLGIRPPPIDEDKLPTYESGPAPRQTGYEKPKPKQKRAGSVE